MAKISAALEKFIRQYIHGIDVLEMIVLLQDHPEQHWASLAVSRALAIDQERARQQLDRLAASGLVSRAITVDGTIYFYRPDSAEKDEIVSELAVAYRNFPIQISNLLYSEGRTETWGT